MKALIIACGVALVCCHFANAQRVIQGTVFDSHTKEPLIGANVLVSGSGIGVASDINGNFSLPTAPDVKVLEVSYVGYDKQIVTVAEGTLSVGLLASTNSLDQVVVTANREATLRTESPVAISKISAATIHENKPVLIAELMNQVSGVVMLNYNNEQHGMAIRQPMGTSAYFLYLEDGIPLRPMGIFNHNALIEMNVFGVSSVEVVKGPASSLYGPEAVGGAVNFISHKPTAVPTARVGVQADQWGYKRIQYAAAGTIGKKLGIHISGFEARQRDSWQNFSDYSKSSVNARVDYSLTKKTRLTVAFAANKYFSDMAGSVDSISFYNREYTSTTDFTYRQVHSLRTRFTVDHKWNDNNETILSLVHRDNYIEQNPNYAIRWLTGSTSASGERNRNSFNSKVALLQHTTRFNFKGARLVAGASIDMSPTNYWAYKIDLTAHLREDGKTVEKFSILQEQPDQFISNYQGDLYNSALYTQFDIQPFYNLRITLGLRYDKMSFAYDNFLNSTSGTKTYDQITPKVGATFDLGKDKGLYANYSQGFAPPGLTSIFRKKPNTNPEAPAEFYSNLEPARFDNFEIGGWASLLGNKLYVDFAAYQMTGQKELLSIRQPDNSTDYQSVGKTVHRGIEYGINFKPGEQWFFRFGGTNALHRFEAFTLSSKSSDQVQDVNGKDMPQSPRWITNSEVTFKPKLLDGLRLSIEWQRMSSWYQDQVNTVEYADKGFLGLRGISYLNFRIGYTWKGVEVFTNIMNVSDELYANSATRGNTKNDRTTFTPAAPRTFVMGIQYNFTGKK